jgi:hypothetical protein
MPIDYRSVTATAKRLKLSRQRVLQMCTGGQLPGATRLDKTPRSPWLIPSDAKPIRERK